MEETAYTLQSKLIFVYNANSGKLNAYLDMLHKIVSPATYPCKLCDITYGISKIRPEWKEFKENYSIPMEFLHKDEWEQAYPGMEEQLPAIFKVTGAGLDVLVSKEEFEVMDLGILMSVLDDFEEKYRAIPATFRVEPN